MAPKVPLTCVVIRIFTQISATHSTMSNTCEDNKGIIKRMRRKEQDAALDMDSMKQRGFRSEMAAVV